MPNIKSAIKRVKINEKKASANKSRRSEMRTAIKKAQLAIADGSSDAENLVKEAIAKTDKAVSKGILHKNTAARKKSKLTKALNKA